MQSKRCLLWFALSLVALGCGGAAGDDDADGVESEAEAEAESEAEAEAEAEAESESEAEAESEGESESESESEGESEAESESEGESESESEAESESEGELSSAAADIGEGGGEIGTDDVELVVPIGAVDTLTTITVSESDETPPDGYELYSPVYEFGPEPLEFEVPVTVTFAVPVDDIAEAAIFWSNEVLGGFDQLPTTRGVDTVSAQVWHFSLGFVANAADHPCAFACCRDSDCPEPDPEVDGQCVELPATCVAGTCVYTEKEDETECDDLDACTLFDYCEDGACVSGYPVSCSHTADTCGADGLLHAHSEACDPPTGECFDFDSTTDCAATYSADACANGVIAYRYLEQSVCQSSGQADLNDTCTSPPYVSEDCSLPTSYCWGDGMVAWDNGVCAISLDAGGVNRATCTGGTEVFTACSDGELICVDGNIQRAFSAETCHDYPSAPPDRAYAQCEPDADPVDEDCRLVFPARATCLSTAGPLRTYEAGNCVSASGECVQDTYVDEPCPTPALCETDHCVIRTTDWYGVDDYNAPIPRDDAKAVSGSEPYKFIVTGGRTMQQSNTSTGMEAVFAPGRFDAWEAMSATGEPSPRFDHTAVWTGTQMIVWGGTEMIVWGGTDATFSPTNTGGRYNPSDNTWFATNVVAESVPDARSNHVAVWASTVQRMLVWGGLDAFWVPMDSGGSYDPTTDTWGEMTTDGAPSARSGHTAVWTDTKMIIWGGDMSDPQGAIYDPSEGTWVRTAASNIPSRSEHTAVFAAGKMVIWGGGSYEAYADGDVYDPDTNTWTAIPAHTDESPAPTPATSHTAVSTSAGEGGLMIVFGGEPTAGTPYAGIFDPATNSWATAEISTHVPASRRGHVAVWTYEGAMIIWGGTEWNGESFESAPVNTAFEYIP